MARFGSSKKNGGRSLFKPAFWMFSICSLLATTATLGEKFLNGGDDPMSSLAGLLSPQTAEGSQDASKSGQVTLITPSGQLTDEQRAWLLEQAKKGAPIPLDKTGAATSPGVQRDATLEQLEKALKDVGG